MRIEKLSDTQLKIVLSRKDLDDHGIRPEELSAASAKTQGLFREVMEQAVEECDFPIENTPLMVEAVPVGGDGIMVIVTKLPEGDPGDAPQIMQVQTQKNPRRYKRTGFIEENQTPEEDGDLYVYSFAALDDAAAAAARLQESFWGQSDLYKLKDKYFMVLQGSLSDQNDPSLVLGEYGDRYPANSLSRSFLSEHGQLLIRLDALDILSEHLT